MKADRRKFMKIGASAGLIPWANQIFAKSCSTKQPAVFVGGVVGFDSLANPKNSRNFRRMCRTGLYIHGYIWTRTPSQESKAILDTFEGLPIDVELGMVATPESWFQKVYRPEFLDVGVRAGHAHVNGFSTQPIDIWKRFVKAGQDFGLETVAPIFSPNHRQYQNASFASPTWDTLREAAKIGGAITTDSPPQFFLNQPPAYRKFVADELSWANEKGLHSTFIVSPASSGDKFLDDTRRAVDFLAQNNALPKSWIVENYDPKASSFYANRIGSEDDSETVLGVALWLAKHAS
ncbi:hypothetical protein [Burkholderia multivorans]|uniref:hypothetical protein n=1 Tax=Burkholderia multivorans TaxID=87883 RepID=UPI001C248076|nr:hypothetical protein [Burkholderia multivorans]MBU9478467.1 hypothetical protein [Burkholderia multivorans]